jgi:hypothetical protein
MTPLGLGVRTSPSAMATVSPILISFLIALVLAAVISFFAPGPDKPYDDA